ncbi:unnamed protein product [Lathyrus sativus]|nr:unnamed protein product [Lathyrus sativus]
MARVRKKSTPEENEQEKIQRKGKRKLASTVDDDDANEEMDEFEVDGFLVGSDEDEEDSDEEDNSKQTQKKKIERDRQKTLFLMTMILS